MSESKDKQREKVFVSAWVTLFHHFAMSQPSIHALVGKEKVSRILEPSLDGWWSGRRGLVGIETTPLSMPGPIFMDLSFSVSEWMDGFLVGMDGWMDGRKDG